MVCGPGNSTYGRQSSLVEDEMRQHVEGRGSLLADYWYQQPGTGEMLLELPAHVVFHPSIATEVSLGETSRGAAYCERNNATF